jgi:hypothetical protein
VRVRIALAKLVGPQQQRVVQEAAVAAGLLECIPNGGKKVSGTVNSKVPRALSPLVAALSRHKPRTGKTWEEPV